MIPSQHQSGACVPIFALHPTRSYYLPLSVDYGLLAPYMVSATAAGNGGGSSSSSNNPGSATAPVPGTKGWN